jgi:hypothetical protein
MGRKLVIPATGAGSPQRAARWLRFWRRPFWAESHSVL